jgi:hypothetical protein
LTIPSRFFKSSPTDDALAPSHPAAALSDLAAWRTPYALLRKRSAAWGPKTPASTPTTALTSASPDSSSPTLNKIPRPHASSPFPSPSSRKRSWSPTPPLTPATRPLAT